MSSYSLIYKAIHVGLVCNCLNRLILYAICSKNQSQALSFLQADDEQVRSACESLFNSIATPAALSELKVSVRLVRYDHIIVIVKILECMDFIYAHVYTVHDFNGVDVENTVS